MQRKGKTKLQAVFIEIIGGSREIRHTARMHAVRRDASTPCYCTHYRLGASLRPTDIGIHITLVVGMRDHKNLDSGVIL